jgi:hypothetical protein
MWHQLRCWHWRHRRWTPFLSAARLYQVLSAASSMQHIVLHHAHTLPHVQQALICQETLALVTGAGQALSGSLTLWNMRSFKRISSLSAGKVPVSSLAFSPDGLLLAAATHGGMVQLFNPHTREPVPGWPVRSALRSAMLESSRVCRLHAMQRSLEG